MDIPFLGELLALISAACYGFSAVAISKNAEAGGTANGAYLSVVLTAALAGGLWLVMGRPLPPAGGPLYQGLLFSALAGVLANVFGRVVMFRATELLGAVEIGILRRLIPVFAALFAVVFLSERITAAMGLGFALIFAAVAIVIATAPPDTRSAATPARARSRAPGDLRRGRLLGAASSASYAGSYVSRKFALQGLPDPLMGTFIGAVTGLLCAGAIALVSPRGRSDLRALLRRPSRWETVAAASVSAGQIVLFFALNHADVTVVAILGSVEIFVAAWLSALLLKTEHRPGPGFAVASLLALAGTAIIAAR